jgi:HAD superfamily hydrolase (TIGR01484 family)
MFFAALATDYDGTIATDGHTPAYVVDALKKFKTSGRRLILVTGRELDDLKAAFPEHDIFDRIVAENGALLYDPSTQSEKTLGSPPPESFIRALKEADIAPLSVGRVIVASWEPNEAAVLDIIKTLGLELQIIFNKGAVMVLPPGINKASGLAAALDDLGLSAVNVAGVGDAENDHAFLKLCGCCAAVANALPELKAQADLVMDEPRGEGVMTFMARLAAEDGELLPLDRHGIMLGEASDIGPVLLPTQAGNVLIAGQSAVGKSTIATALTEQMTQKGLQFCILDPEGDFEHLDHAVQVGSASLPASLTEVADLLRNADNNVVINAMAVALEDRPKFFAAILAIVSETRIRSSRPHWLIVDEAHHVLPQGSHTAGQGLPRDLTGTIFITVHPDSMAKTVLDAIQFVVAAGEAANDVLSSFCKSVDETPPNASDLCAEHKVLLWDRRSSERVICLSPSRPAQIHRRHTRKYAQGELGPDKSFYFRGPDEALNLRADNLKSFLSIADGVDDGTWTFHRERGDYSHWFKGAIKDEGLADAAASIKQDDSLDADASRAKLRAEIERRYTAPASESSR